MSAPELEAEDREALRSFVLGARVKVKGSIRDAVFTAYDLAPEDEDEETRFEGPIQQLDPQARVLRMLDRDIRVPEGITIKNLLRDRVSLETLEVGDVIVAKGEYEAGSGFEPRKIKRERVYGFAVEEVCGPLEALDLTRLTLRVAGVEVRLTADTRIRAK